MERGRAWLEASVFGTEWHIHQSFCQRSTSPNGQVGQGKYTRHSIDVWHAAKCTFILISLIQLLSCLFHTVGSISSNDLKFIVDFV